MTYRISYSVTGRRGAGLMMTAYKRSGSFVVEAVDAEAAVIKGREVLDDALKVGMRLLRVPDYCHATLASCLPCEAPGPEWDRLLDALAGKRGAQSEKTE